MKLYLAKEEIDNFKQWQYSSHISSAVSQRAKALLNINDGRTVTETARLIGISRTKLYKWISRYLSGDSEWYLDKSKKPLHSPLKISTKDIHEIIMISNKLMNSGVGVTATSIKSYLIKNGQRYPSNTSIYKILGKAKREGLIPKNAININFTDAQKRELSRISKGQTIPTYLAKRANMILLAGSGLSPSQISNQLGTDARIVEKWQDRFKDSGINGLYNKKFERPHKDCDETIRSEVFSLLHSPPSDYQINRTSWIIPDLKKCLEKKGIIVSKAVISRIIKSAGYRWKKARIVLTSPDPYYREKLDKVKNVLINLKSNERFFSVDEMGPLAIRKREGRKLVAPNENHYIQQFQPSKGKIILTAALELSTNQVTHIYSDSKNTTETIKLIEVLLIQYEYSETLYFSWDAASWHDSKILNHYVETNNEKVKNRGYGPKIIIVPLPKSAQFLNVIESVFSGLAKAVIHNSDYSSKEAAIAAIDLYFEERNKYYKLNPKRVGKKIWGKETVPAEFSESHNCKDPNMS